MIPETLSHSGRLEIKTGSSKLCMDFHLKCSSTAETRYLHTLYLKTHNCFFPMQLHFHYKSALILVDFFANVEKVQFCNCSVSNK